MRKIMLGILAASLAVMPLSGSSAQANEYFKYKRHHHHHHHKKVVKDSSAHHGTNHNGYVALGCGLASATSLMVGSAIMGSDQDKKRRRQLTINEAAWYASACPVFLPWALLVQASCPDNKATYTIATLAYRYLETHPAGDQSAFTTAYGEACRTGKLSPEFVAFVSANGLYARAATHRAISPRG